MVGKRVLPRNVGAAEPPMLALHLVDVYALAQGGVGHGLGISSPNNHTVPISAQTSNATIGAYFW